MIRSAAVIVWRAFLMILTYISVAIVLINLQPAENVNTNPLLRAIERIAFGVVAGLLTYRILRKVRHDNSN